MIDIKNILSLPPDERDDEIRKLLDPGPWKHKHFEFLAADPYHCRKCGKDLRTGKDWCRNDPCSVPDPIALNWNLAMKMRDDPNLEPAKFAHALERVCNTQNRMDYQFALWLVWEARPHHYILAALKAKERK